MDINKKGLEETERLCLEAGATNVVTKVIDVTETETVRQAIEGFDEMYPIDVVYPCAALNDTPRKPLPNTVTVDVFSFTYL